MFLGIIVNLGEMGINCVLVKLCGGRVGWSPIAASMRRTTVVKGTRRSCRLDRREPVAHSKPNEGYANE